MELHLGDTRQQLAFQALMAFQEDVIGLTESMAVEALGLKK